MKYKIGDKVRIKSIDWYNENKDEYGYVRCIDILFTSVHSKYCGKVMTISHVRVDHYTMVEDLEGYWTDEMIECLVEEETKTKFKVGDIVYSRAWQRNVIIREILSDCVYKVGDLYNEWWFKAHEDTLDKENVKPITEYTLPDGYIFKDENGNVINAMKIVLEKKKKEYPKTYEECCDKINFKGGFKEILLNDDEYSLYIPFIKLKRCRDAYWKLYGEKMELEKPWEPDWTEDNAKYSIYTIKGVLTKAISCYDGAIFVFPTPEMRDAFYENFKVEIEICKELL